MIKFEKMHKTTLSFLIIHQNYHLTWHIEKYTVFFPDE